MPFSNQDQEKKVNGLQRDVMAQDGEEGRGLL
jgi:hypothetical protein